MRSNEYLANYFARRPKADDTEIERFVKFYGGTEEDALEVLEVKNKLRQKAEQ